MPLLPLLQLHHQPYPRRTHGRGLSVQRPHIDDSQPSDLQQVNPHLGRLPVYFPVGLLNDNYIVGSQLMAPQNEIESGFAFANGTLAYDQRAETEDLNQDTMQAYVRSKLIRKQT